MANDPKFRAAVIKRMGDPADLQPCKTGKRYPEAEKAAKRLKELMHQHGLI